MYMFLKEKVVAGEVGRSVLQIDQLFLQLLNPLVSPSENTHSFGSVKRLGLFRSLAINRNAFQPQFQRLYKGACDLLHRALI